MPRPSRDDETFAQIAQRHGLLDAGQVEEALREVRAGGKGRRRLADVVRARGWLSPSAVRAISRAVEFRRSRLEGKLYGRIAVKNRFARLSQVRQCLDEQKALYRDRKRVPHLGELMRSHGFVTEVQDAAIRQALEKLDPEEFVARRDAGEPLVEQEQDAPEAPGLELGEGGEDEAAFEAISEDLERVAGEPAVAELLEEEDDSGGVAVLEEAEPAVESESAISGEDLVAAAGAGEPAGASHRDFDTRDELDALLRPDDLRLEEETAVAAEASDDEELELPAAFAQPPGPGPGQAAEFEGVGDIEGFDELTAFSDSEDALEQTRQAAAIALGQEAAECPQCKVELGPGTTECLYCGYRFVEGPTSNDITDEVVLEGEELEPLAAVSGPELGAAGASADSLDEEFAEVESLSPPAPQAQAGLREVSFDQAFTAAEIVAEGARGSLLRATAAEGSRHWVWRLPEELAPSDEQIEAFLADVRRLDETGLRHFVPLAWLGRDTQGLYAVYADAPGRPATVQAAEAPLERIAAARVVKHVACALRDAAEAELLPRELRPEGVLLPEDEKGEPRIVGFGLTRLFEPPATGAPDVEADPYVPPERKRKADRADARTSLYGLGALLVLLLTGSGPVEGELPDVPGAMRSFLQKTLSRATGKRYLDFSKVFFDLDRCPGARGLEVATR